MIPELRYIVSDAKTWLTQQSNAESQSAAWYTLGHVQAFIDQLEAASTAIEIDKAVWTLSRFLSDQYEIPADGVKLIQGLLSRVRRVSKSVIWNST